jgi:hypothetical protein
MPLHAWRLPREEPRRHLHELKRAHDVSVKLFGRQHLAAVEVDDNRHASVREEIEN